MKKLYCAISFFLAQFIVIPSHADLTTGLIAYYPLSMSTKDVSGNSNHARSYGNRYGKDRQGRVKSAYLFQKNGDRVEIDSRFTSMKLRKLSISLWFKSTKENNSRVSCIFENL